MRALLLALLASTGCSQILGLDDIEPAGGDAGPQPIMVEGRVYAYGSTNGQGMIGLALDSNDGATTIKEASTDAAGTFSMTVPAPVLEPPHLRTQDEGTGRAFIPSYLQFAESLESTADVIVTVFTQQDVMAVHASAGIGTIGPVVRVVAIDANTQIIAGATVTAIKNGLPTGTVRYTNEMGEPVSGQSTTTIGPDSYAYGYIFGLAADSYTFSASYNGMTGNLPYSVLVEDNSVVTVSIRVNVLP